MAVSTIMDMNLEENLKTPFSIIWDQVSYLLKHRTQAQDYFKKMDSKADALELLAALLHQAFNF